MEKMTVVKIKVTDKDSAEYEAARLARLERLAKNAPVGVKHKWVAPKLNPDGSLTEEEREKVKRAKAGSADQWGGEAKKND